MQYSPPWPPLYNCNDRIFINMLARLWLILYEPLPQIHQHSSAQRRGRELDLLIFYLLVPARFCFWAVHGIIMS